MPSLSETFHLHLLFMSIHVILILNSLWPQSDNWVSWRSVLVNQHSGFQVKGRTVKYLVTMTREAWGVWRHKHCSCCNVSRCGCEAAAAVGWHFWFGEEQTWTLGAKNQRIWCCQRKVESHWKCSNQIDVNPNLSQAYVRTTSVWSGS